MKIAIAADHAGFSLKEKLRDELKAAGHEVQDYGTNSDQSTDYPDYALAVGEQVAHGRVDRGILVCGSGVGMSIAANKIRGVRAALGVNEEEVAVVRDHNDANILALGARFTDKEQASKLVKVFLETPFSNGDRHVRRLNKIAELEKNATAAGGQNR